ncbi:hypothetical protein DICVIV_11615 [Dictyocaulus viviparus]|uniref:Uncharacterized protein n=1 Tax=Dictyocaulus viviparus TaxID=29172 RepID=A0A0D8XCS1_DICVI|nr:hypothetical protein DICVIV_11615 [Dictyocaulus viviparus]
MTTSKYADFLTSFLTNYPGETTSSSPQPPTLVIPQTTIPLWMVATTKPSFHGQHEINEGNRKNEDKIVSDLEREDEHDKGVNKVSKTAIIEAGGQKTSAVNWIVAAIAVIVLLLILLATIVFVLRYVKQSRKLHGKYNPAREEHALSAAYSMPMSHISKEERLI